MWGEMLVEFRGWLQREVTGGARGRRRVRVEEVEFRNAAKKRLWITRMKTRGVLLPSQVKAEGVEIDLEEELKGVEAELVERLGGQNK